MSLPHITHISDLGPAGVAEILDTASAWKKSGYNERFAKKLFGMIYFNPSLRTRTSFEAGMLREGGNAIILDVGVNTWKLEHEDGIRMDHDKAEHLKEAVPVLSRYVDALGVRSFSNGISDEDDDLDAIVKGFRKYSEVPVLSLESAREHPCQGLADVLTLRENFGETKGLTVTLTWAPHIKPLPKAVPNSFLLTCAAAGCNVKVAHPEGFDLPTTVLEEAQNYASETGGSVEVTHNLEDALSGSHALYAKAWRPADGLVKVLDQSDWMPTMDHFEKMESEAIFMHCLPVRRNLEVGEDVLDSPRSRVTDEAENRFHVQRALLGKLFGVTR